MLMNTEDILRGCRALPGVTLKTCNGEAELLLSSCEGEGHMCFHTFFPGITMADIHVNAAVWPAPRLTPCEPDARGPLIINYCIRGRCELILNDNRHVFLTNGGVSLTERFAQKEYLYPGRLYEGFELFIDPETVLSGQPMLREWFDLDLARLREKYCPNGETFIAPMQLPDAIPERLGGLNGCKTCPTHRKTAMIDFLALLLSENTMLSPDRLVYYTRTQVEIAKRTEEIISADLSRQHTVREFAELFSVSESSVKNYFSGVFGLSISQYMVRRRMQYAAELLVHTHLPVIEVANRVGYLNQSKFSAAFRRMYASTPLEYRRAGKLFDEKR